MGIPTPKEIELLEKSREDIKQKVIHAIKQNLEAQFAEAIKKRTINKNGGELFLHSLIVGIESLYDEEVFNTFKKIRLDGWYDAMNIFNAIEPVLNKKGWKFEFVSKEVSGQMGSRTNKNFYKITPLSK